MYHIQKKSLASTEKYKFSKVVKVRSVKIVQT